MPRLSSFVPASVGTGPITELATKVYEHLNVDLEDVNECDVAHFYQCLKKNDLNPSPDLEDDVLLEDYARRFRDYVNSGQVDISEWPYHPVGYLSEDNFDASERNGSDGDSDGGYSRRTMQGGSLEEKAPTPQEDDIMDLLAVAIQTVSLSEFTLARIGYCRGS